MYKVSCCAVPGFGHNRENYLSCQDVVAEKHSNTIAAACLCDGAGSSRFAREGAEAVSYAVCNYLFNHHFSFFNMTDIQKNAKIIDISKSAVKKIIGSTGNGVICDYNCTLLAVLANANDIVVLHIGDGLIAIEEGGDLSVLSAPENGEYKNQTYFITGDEAEKHLRISKYKNIDKSYSIVLMSDGSSTSFWKDNEKRLISQNALKTLCSMNMALEQDDMNGVLRENLFEVISGQTNDDCSMIIISKVKDEKIFKGYRR